MEKRTKMVRNSFIFKNRCKKLTLHVSASVIVCYNDHCTMAGVCLDVFLRLKFLPCTCSITKYNRQHFDR